MGSIKKSAKGVTLIEGVVVMAVVATLAMIIIPACVGYINKAKERVCETNCLQIERMYQAHLELENREHNDIEFSSFLLQYADQTCPSKGNMSCVEGKVVCDRHQELEDGNGEVPIV